MLDPTVPPKYKSRLVVRGDLEEGDPRSDSPTADLEAQNMIFSFAASRKLEVCSLDVTDAYFQGEEIDRVLLLKQPKGGLPGLQPEDHMLARAPIYGSHDGGRRFWKRLRTYLNEKGLRENRILKACTAIQTSQERLIASHVDDLLWACEESAQWVIDDIIKTFKCGEVDKRNFRYCGKEISQADDFSITAKCSDTTRNIKKIHIKSGRHPGDPLTDADRTQLKSVAGSLSWVSRQCRPDLAYRVSRIQSSASKGTVSDLKEANKAVEYALRTHDVGLTFKSNVLDWDKLMCLVVTDASHANESEEMIVNGAVSIEAHRSQDDMSCFSRVMEWQKGSFSPYSLELQRGETSLS